MGILEMSMGATVARGADGEDANMAIPRMNTGVKGLKDGGAEDGGMTTMTGLIRTGGTKSLGGADIAPVPAPLNATSIGDVRRPGDTPRQGIETREMGTPIAVNTGVRNIDIIATKNSNIVVSDGGNQVNHIRPLPLVLWTAKVLRRALKVHHQSFRRKCLSIAARSPQVQHKETRRPYPRHLRHHAMIDQWTFAEQPKERRRR